MALKVQLIPGFSALNTLLRGGIAGGIDLRQGLVYGLDGKTLVFSAPTATVTFTTENSSQQDGLSLVQVLEQINNQAGLEGFARAVSGALVIENPAGTTNVTLSDTGTANTLLGFSDEGAAGKFYAAPGGSAPALVSAGMVGGTPTLLLITDE